MPPQALLHDENVLKHLPGTVCTRMISMPTDANIAVFVTNFTCRTCATIRPQRAIDALAAEADELLGRVDDHILDASAPNASRNPVGDDIVERLEFIDADVASVCENLMVASRFDAFAAVECDLEDRARALVEDIDDIVQPKDTITERTDLRRSRSPCLELRVELRESAFERKTSATHTNNGFAVDTTHLVSQDGARRRLADSEVDARLLVGP